MKGICAGGLLLLTILLCDINCKAEQPTKKVICYFTNWAAHRSEQGKFLPENIEPKLCTHIVYAYAVLDPQTLTIKSPNPAIDIDDGFYKRVTDLRQRGVKVLIALGGLTDSVGNKYDRLLTDANASRRFIASVMAFIHEHNFDGLDIEYPASRIDLIIQDELTRAQTKQGFAQLVRELSEAFEPNGWLLSASVSANPAAVDAGYDVPQLNRYLDWISLTAYDYHSSYEGQTEYIAPISSSDNLNIKSTVQYWIRKGAAPEKLILGMPTYGQSYTLTDPQRSGLNSPSIGAGQMGPYSATPGTLAYYEICNNTKHNGWINVREVEQKIGSYATHGDQWVSYDDIENIRAKSKYIRDMNLGGGMVWSLDFDDFRGICGYGKFPLLAALNLELRGVGNEWLKNSEFLTKYHGTFSETLKKFVGNRLK